MSIILVIHSRWLVLLIAVIAVVKFAIGWLRSGAFKGMDRGLAAPSGAMVQATLGLIVILWLVHPDGGGFHAIVLNMPHDDPCSCGRTSTCTMENIADSIRFRNTLFASWFTAAGHLRVASLPGGWR
jgi:hypothetical protein